MDFGLLEDGLLNSSPLTIQSSTCYEESYAYPSMLSVRQRTVADCSGTLDLHF